MIKFLFIIILTLSIVSCKSDKKSGDNIVDVPISDEISTLDPANAYDTISASVIYQAYEQLYEYHYLKRPYTLQPLLAEGPPRSDEKGTTYTIKIKKGIRYHDDPAFEGKPRFVKAQDFINQIKRLAFIKTRSNGWWLFEGKIVGLDNFRKEAGSDLQKFESLDVEGLQAPDDQTLVIKLVEPYPQLKYAFSMSFTSPMPIEAIRLYKNNLNDRLVGTGPFMLDSWTQQLGLKLKRNPNYRDVYYPAEGDRIANVKGLLSDANKKIPFLDGIQYHIIKESQTRWLKFRNKELDSIVIPKDNYTSAVDSTGRLSEELKKDNIKLQVFPSLTYWWLSFNMNDPILGKNLNLRKAIAHAIDTEKYIRVFTNNTGLKANSIYPPGVPGYDPGADLPYEYNLDMAKEYLAKAGYPNGEGLPELKYDVRGNSATNRQQANFIKSELAKIGIKVKGMTNTFPGFLDKARKGQLQFWQDGWAMDYPDAENTLQLLVAKNHSPGPNSTFYNNPEFDEIFERLKNLEDGKEKFNLMKELELMVHGDLPWVMQYYQRVYLLHHDRLRNFRPSDLIYNYYKYLKL